MREVFEKIQALKSTYLKIDPKTEKDLGAIKALVQVEIFMLDELERNSRGLTLPKQENGTDD